MIIYGRADIARELGVTAPAVSNYIRRFNDWPPATYETPDGVMYWDTQGLVKWRRWSEARKSQVAGLPAGTTVGTKNEHSSQG